MASAPANLVVLNLTDLVCVPHAAIPMAVDSAKTSEQRLIGPDFREDSVQLDG